MKESPKPEVAGPLAGVDLTRALASKEPLVLLLPELLP